MTSPIIGFICGSLRAGSMNKSLTNDLMRRFANAGAQTRRLDLGDYDLPIYHGDLQQPAGVKRLSADMRACRGIVIISPEYNGSLPALLKNAIDWVSTAGRDPFTQPAYGIASCTPGALCGIMVLRELNYILTRIGADVVPVHVGVGFGEDAFDEQGVLTSQASSERADLMVKRLLNQIEITADS